ncbi:MAG TPA: right-handed parallel beta-helix repeat-containing protein [Anaerolineaceae bacterium]|nr:right-handed parallel beta-helix repeat-containing protein [Anaerolineaceae bacterium]
MPRRFSSLMFISILLCAGLLAAAPAQPARADTYTVTNSSSSGAGSLRQAILDANNHAGQDIIGFAIPTSDPGYSSALGVWFLRLSFVLPMLEDPAGVVIDGSTQPGSSPDLPGIIIEHTTAVPVGVSLLKIISQDNTIKYLGFFNGRGDGVIIDGDQNVLMHNQIFASAGYGVHLLAGAEENSIDGNKICGHALDGIRLQSAHHNVINNNSVGEQPLYLPSVGRNLGNGISLIQSDSNTISGNLISNNTLDGLLLSESDENQILQNTIGLNLSRTSELGNGGYGILLEQSAGNLVDETWISGNDKDGIRLTGANAAGNILQRNSIGASYSGPIPNAQHGIGLYNGAHDNTIGSGSDGDLNNLILYNGWSGVAVVDSALGSNVIGNNFIYNQEFYGIHINNSVSNALVANTIAGNGGIGDCAGVRIENSSGTEGAADINLIWDNSIRNNHGKGIQLVGGANNGIAAPVITSASCKNVLGIACPGCWVQVFSDDYDEGRVLEGVAVANSFGVFSLSSSFTGPHLTAVAVDGPGNSSEFSLPALGCFRHWLPILMK